MSDMLLEVDEALRAQQLKALWEQFGQWIIGLAVLAVIGTAVGVTWHNHTNKVLGEQTAQLLTILQNEATSSDTPQQLEALAKKSNLPLQVVAGLYQAQKLEQGNDLKAARQAYGTLMKQSGGPKVLRDLARVHFVRLGMVQKDKPEDLLAAIEPLTAENSFFHASAMEMKATLLVQQGKTKEADAIFSHLAVEQSAPDSIRARAKSMMAAGGK